MVGLFRTIVIVVIIYYAFKFISRYILPLFLKKMVENVQKKYGEQQKTYDKTEGKVGETVIAKKPVEKKESNKDVGDYVDYEDVKD